MVDITSKEILSFGNRVGYAADAVVSGLYSTGGMDLDTDKLFGIHNPDLVMLEAANGYRFQYDKATKKLKAFTRAPLVVYDELHEIDPVTGLFTLKYPAAFIMNAAMTGGQNLKLRSTGKTIATMNTSEASLPSQMAAGVPTQIRCGVGLVPDLLAGSNGGFTGNATGWTLGAGWTYDANDVHRAASAVTTLAHDSFVPVVGKTYKVVCSFNAFTAGSLTVSLGGVTGAALTDDTGPAQYFTATSTDGLVITPNAACACELNTVYIILMEAKVTYITQAWKEVWENLVQDEAVTLATGANNLANKVLAMMYVDQTTTTAAALTMVDEDDTVASGEVEVAFNTATAQLTVHADQNTKAAKVTYLKVPDSGFLKDRLIHNETATKSGADPFVSTFDLPILLWGYTGCAPVNTGTTQRLIDFTSTPEAGEAVLDWFNRGTRGAGAIATGTPIGTKSDVTLTGAYVWGTIDEIPDQVDLEAPDESDMSAITSARMLIIGT